MVKYKLYYFPIRGRGEVIRLIFAHAGVEYEDIRIPFPEWPQHKSSMPLLQMPVLEVDGVKLPQSGAIARYLAKKYDLTGKTDMDSYWADVYFDALEDIAKKYPSPEEEEKKRVTRLMAKTMLDVEIDRPTFDVEEMIKEFVNVIAPEGLQKVEKFYKELNKGKDCYLVGEQLTYADLAFTSYMDFFMSVKPDIFAGAPGLQGVYTRVRELPNIKAWIEKRPKTGF